MFSVTWEKMMLRKGVIQVKITSVIVGPYPPAPTFIQKGGFFCPFFCPLLRHGAVNPNYVPKKEKQNVFMLGMGCGHLASASEQFKLMQVGARTGTSRGPVFPTRPPMD